ncbi:MAG: structural protein P5 [Prevotella sp.]|jgi:hypothetical protein|nr:structural protein P5 [Prevotella sp.]MCH3994277.1 structural protein P5 [Prevotella sp.]
MLKSRGLRNNNPGNIRISGIKYQGEIRPSKDRNFKQFVNMSYGYRAMFVILRTYYNRYGLNTISKMIQRWAPSNENDTTAYITHVSVWSGIPKNATLEITSKAMMCAVVAAMSRMENGTRANMLDVRKGWELI